MKHENVNPFNEKLRERTLNMAVDVRNLLSSLKINPIDRSVINQLLRCSSSVAANYRAANRGRSDAEFYSKICIVVEEADETHFWLEYFLRIQIVPESKTIPLLDELQQLIRLFASIKKTMKAKLEAAEGNDAGGRTAQC